MKRTLVMEPTSLVERFTTWAHESGRRPGWYTAQTGDGRSVLILFMEQLRETSSEKVAAAADLARAMAAPGFRVILTSGVDDDSIYAVAGYAVRGEEQQETTVGSLPDDPSHVLQRTVSWLLENAEEYAFWDLTESALHTLGAALHIASSIDDEKLVQHCLKMLNDVAGED